MMDGWMEMCDGLVKFPRCRTFFSRFDGLLLTTAVLLRASDALQVIGGNKTVLHGDSVILPCKLIDTTETLTQISWQRKTRGKPQLDSFFTVVPPDKQRYLNGNDNRFRFAGNASEMDGSLQLSNVTLLDEGTYSCIFTLFPTGDYKTDIPLTVIVPPVTHVKDNLPFLGEKEVPIATCTAAGSRPPAEVKWLIGTLAEKLRHTTNSTQHANGTTTTASTLFGVPTKGINQKLVHCVITSQALLKEVTVPFTIQSYFPPSQVIITVTGDRFQCETEANPPADFIWKRSDQVLPQPAVTEGAELRFPRLGSNLNGLYECEAFNQFGKHSGYLKLRLQKDGSPTCWILLSLLLLLLIGIIGFILYLYKSGKLPWIEERMHMKRQKVPRSPNEMEGRQDDMVEEENVT
ncbi:nectin-3-like protein [Echeneis naucrates]|uniref:nectin-3-like protein n=1 Tax=Echeneis naucrates TaxID=173247 RepID=UPI0011138895|nr:nectin-3-like protein [Echeneis naucrates]